MKRFYEDVSLLRVESGFEVLLDGRAVKTPGMVNLSVPTEALAKAIADEWRAQEDDVVPESMPLTRLANTAIDRVADMPEKISGEIAAEIAAEIVAYASNDLICYRAEVPPDLIAAQSTAWDSYIDWAGERFGTRPETTSGIVHIDQPDALVVAVTAALASKDAFQLAALHNLTSLSGSAFVAMFLAEAASADGAADGVMTAEAAWNASRVDEAFQQARWGEDDEAAAKSANDFAMFMAAARFNMLLCA